MIKTTLILVNELNNYKSPNQKIRRMVVDGQLTPIIKGLYETDRNTPAHLLAASIYGPSYLSFEFALAYYGLIPETVYTCTSATYGKLKLKKYDTPFGVFTYRDIPSEAYPFGITALEENGYGFLLASPEKALCDQLYKMPVVANQREVGPLLFDNLRIDKTEFAKLNNKDMIELCEKYHSTNLKHFAGWLKRNEQ